MVSHQHRCIFIHIPKTAGSSIEKELGHFQTISHDVQDHRTVRELEPFAMRHLGQGLVGKDPYLLKRLRNRLGGEVTASSRQYREYFKFTFVRNTWARTFSWYRNVMTNEQFMAERGIDAEIGLKQFLIEHPDEWGARSQLYWIENSEGNVPLDFIGRFESLEQDWRQVGKILGFEDRPLPHLVVGEGRKYVDFYDQGTIDLVAERYHREIEMFGFKFGE